MNQFIIRQRYRLIRLVDCQPSISKEDVYLFFGFVVVPGTAGGGAISITLTILYLTTSTSLSGGILVRD